MKLCTKCKFEIVNKDESWCKNCKKEYLKFYRENNKEKIKTLNQNWRSSNKEYNKEMKYNYYCSLKGRIVEINRSAKRRSKNKNIEFDLDVLFLENLWNSQNGNCKITNLPLEINNKRNNGKPSPFSPSLDRICCDKGYTKDNVRFVCYMVNCGLHDYGISVFDRIAKAYICNEIIDYNDNYRFIEPKSKKSISNKKYAESFKGTLNTLFNQCKKHANEKMEFNISKAHIENMLQKNVCSITNIPFCYKLYGDKRSNPFRPSVDRINSDIGYTNNNTRIVCVAVNYFLNEFGEDNLRKVCHSYINNYLKS